jgi:oxygen-independent coproporphyrinogen-3 oxidase
VKSLYIHIPFCQSRCIYCGFYSTTLLALRDSYVSALVSEMKMREPGSDISTIYLGGGTPSQLTTEQLHTILYNINNVYRVARDAEITIECNPDDITEEYAMAIRNMGFNRVSLGAQTFSDERLRTIRRRHNAQQVDNAIAILRKAGFQNISIDLMYGFPGETLSQWQSDIRHAISLQPQHISAYSLMYEEGTPLHRMLTEGKIEETDEDLSLQMFETLVSQLTAAGYEHYEISNFALPSFRSRHNSSYWHDIPYIGLGAAAHSYDLRSRSWNIADAKEYIRIIGTGKRPVEDSETIDADTHYNDIVTTAMRTREGIPLEMLTPEQRRYLLDAAQKMAERGLLTISDTHVSLTHNGIFVSNSVMAELIKA